MKSVFISSLCLFSFLDLVQSSSYLDYKDNNLIHYLKQGYKYRHEYSPYGARGYHEKTYETYDNTPNLVGHINNNYKSGNNRLNGYHGENKHGNYDDNYGYKREYGSYNRGYDGHQAHGRDYYDNGYYRRYPSNQYDNGHGVVYNYYHGQQYDGYRNNDIGYH